MWRIITLSLLGLAAMGCQTEEKPLLESKASLCEMLRQKIEAQNYYLTNDPVTMKRKNAVDQAQLEKEYDTYNCPEIIDEAPSPYQLPE